MEKTYGLQTNKECINVIINGDEALLSIQTAGEIKIRRLDLQSDNEDTEIAKDGAKNSSANKENQPEPLQKALKRIKELERVTDVRIDEEFKATDFNAAENRLTITIDYLDVDIVKEMEKADKYKLY